MDQTPIATPWASILLLIMGVALFSAAAATDTGPANRLRRPLSRLLLLLSGASLVGSVIAGVLG
jgi:hypothetical protein